MTIAPDSMDSKFPYGKDAYQRAFFQSPLIRVLRLGERAVDIFQVLSGFLFARSVYRRKYGGYWTSLVSRYLRLLPPHMAAFALEAILNPYNMRSSCFKALPYHLLMIQNLHPAGLASLMFSWTTAVDMQFHLLVTPVLRRYLIGQRIDRGGKAAAFAFFLNDGRGLVIFFFVGIVIRAYSAFYLEKPIWYANSLATHLSPYIAGIWACMAIEGGDYVLKHELPLQDLSSTSQKESRVTKQQQQQQQQQQQSRFHPTVVAIMFHRLSLAFAALVVLGTYALQPWTPSRGQPWGKALEEDEPFLTKIIEVLVPPLFSFAIARAIVFWVGQQRDLSPQNTGQRAMTAILTSKTVRVLAELSYTTFLIQSVTLPILLAPEGWGLPPVRNWIFPPTDSILMAHVHFSVSCGILLTFTFVSSFVLHGLVEVPARAGRRFLMRKLVFSRSSRVG